MAQNSAAATMSSTEMLARLVAFDTTSHKSNLPLLDFVRGWLAQYGASCRLSYDPTGQKANLHATLGPVQPGGLAFSGHLDTVSTEGQIWTSDPYTLRRQDGRLFGRGTCDMKGFIASVLAAVPDMAAQKLTRPVHLLLTYDEEVGYHGVRRLLEDISDSGLRPSCCVVGEASGMQPVLAQKGRLIFRVGVRGHGAHSSAPHRGVNAVHAAAEAIGWLAAESRRRARIGPMETGFDPPYSTLQTMNVTCDAMPNTVPHQASFDVEWRNIPGDDPMRELARFQDHVATEIEPQMHALRADTGFDYAILLDLAAVSLSPEHELARAACEVLGTTTASKVSYCSEGSIYHPTGIACMVCGPGRLSEVHQPDEWIAESQLAACDSFVRRLVTRMAV